MSTKDWLEKDYYSILGVPSSVDATTLKKTYRKLARAHHPDANKGDPASEARFKEVSEAYDVLSDPKTRAEYDQVRAYVASGGAPPGAGFGGGGPGFGGEGLRINLEDLLRNADGGEFRLSDLFGAAFGGGDFQDGAARGFRVVILAVVDLVVSVVAGAHRALDVAQILKQKSNFLSMKHGLARLCNFESTINPLRQKFPLVCEITR